MGEEYDMGYKIGGKNKKNFPKARIAIIEERETCHGSGSYYGGSHMCKHCQESRTKGAGFAFDYHCVHPSIGKKKVMGYVEYSSDHNPVPDWCPILIKE